MTFRIKPALLWISAAVFSAGASAAGTPTVAESWSADVFTQAKAQQRFVVLRLVESWCRQCALMDQLTFDDPAVRELIGKKFILARATLAARPDVAVRYADFEPPATMIFNADGGEIARIKGFRFAERMATILQEVIDDPTPGPSIKPDPELTYAEQPALPEALRTALAESYWSQYETPDQLSSFGTKYLDRDSFEYALLLARAGDKRAESRLDAHLHAGLLLQDRSAGGIHQSLVVSQQGPQGVHQFGRVQFGGYVDSQGFGWNEAHTEKPLWTEAEALWIYATAYRQWPRKEYLEVAKHIGGYVRTVLRAPDGGFYAGQSGSPPKSAGAGASQAQAGHRDAAAPVDLNQYTDSNAAMVSALCALYRVTKDAETIEAAKQAATWMIKHRALPNRLYRHGGDGTPGYLRDAVMAGQAFLDLYLVSGERAWLDKAQEVAAAIPAAFTGAGSPALLVAAPSASPTTLAKADRVGNARFVRFAAELARHAGKPELRALAAPAMRYLATEEIANNGLSAPVLVADAWFTSPPQPEARP